MLDLVNFYDHTELVIYK